MLTLHHLLLAGICLCVYGTPVRLPDITPTQDGQCASPGATVALTHTTVVKSKPTDAEQVTGLKLNVGVGGMADPHGRHKGIEAVTQTENGDSLDGGSEPSEAGREVWSHRGELKKVRSTSEMGRAERQSEVASVLSVESKSTIEATSTGGRKQVSLDMSTPRLSPVRFLASSTATPQMSITVREIKDQGEEDRTRLPSEDDSQQGKDPETSLPSSEPPNPSARFQRLISQSSAPLSVFVSTPVTIWGNGGATVSPLSEPLLPEIGPNLMPKEDGPESLWTEAARPGGGK